MTFKTQICVTAIYMFLRQLKYININFKYLSKYSVSLKYYKKPFYQQTRLFSLSTMPKSALMILAEGAEEMETVITVDMLRRAGVTVMVAGLDGSAPVLCSRQITLVPDKSLADALAENPQYDAVILPGGLEGSERLSKSEVVGSLLKEHEKSGKIVAAICAAPTAFVAHGVAKNKQVTSYPSTKEKITGEYKYVEGERVVVDGNIVTSRGPGTAYWFGLKLIEMLVGKEKADQVEKGMLISGY